MLRCGCWICLASLDRTWSMGFRCDPRVSAWLGGFRRFESGWMGAVVGASSLGLDELSLALAESSP